MIPLRPLLAALLLLAGLIAAPTPARAAQSYDACAGFITSLPATISTQGVWCLNKDLSTAITSGNAITINTNNVTIDCNDFKLGGLQAGNSSGATGIYALARLNATVRHCTIRGFHYGINLQSGGGHLVEDNRLDQNLYKGIDVSGDNNLVQRNRVYDTGGSPANSYSYGIYANADVIDNTVAGVFATATDAFPRGIYSYNFGNEVSGNRVRGLVVAGGGYAIGIYATGSSATVDGNRISAATTTAGFGINGLGPSTFCSNNTVAEFANAYYSCEFIAHNLP